MNKRIIAVLMAVVMMFSLTACGSSQDSGSTEPAEETKQEEAAEAETGADTETETAAEVEAKDYKLAYAELGEGVWAIDYYMLESKYLIEGIGSEFTYTSSDFTPDKMQSDIQSLLVSGIDGLLYYGSFPTITQGVADMCDEYDVPFVMPDQLPLNEYADIVLASKSFAGAVGSNPYDVGYQMGAYAAEKGGTKALILAGGEGDSCHDGRTNGFIAGFEENGGKVIAVARVANMSDAATSASDLLTANPDIDVYYGATADHGQFALTALENAKRDDVMVYCTDCDNSIIEAVKDGRVIADGGAVICTTLATCLLVNALDGHPIKDADGNSPIFDTCLNFIITAENADTFNENWIQNHIFEVEDYQQLLARYNSDVDYDTFQNFINSYGIDSAK